MARTCPASSVNATISAALSAFDAACQQRGANRTARERSGNAARDRKPRAGKYGSDGSTTRDSPKSPSGGFFCPPIGPLPNNETLGFDRVENRVALAASMAFDRDLPIAIVLDAARRRPVVVRRTTKVVPTGRGGSAGSAKARAISLAVDKRVLSREAAITRPVWVSDDLLAGSVWRRSGGPHLSFGDGVGAASSPTGSRSEWPPRQQLGASLLGLGCNVSRGEFIELPVKRG